MEVLFGWSREHAHEDDPIFIHRDHLGDRRIPLLVTDDDVLAPMAGAL